MTSINFKIFIDDDQVRRIKATDDLNAFKSKIAEFIQFEPILKWKDSDGDLITITTPEEFQEAITEQQGNVVKIWVTSSKKPSATTDDSSVEDSKTDPVPEVKPVVIEPVVHQHVECDGSGENPLRGTRYHKVGENFDLNETEFAKLSDAEKTQYQVILRPNGPVIQWEPVVHYGVICDATNVGPIYGIRFHKIGENYDLCQSEFSKLSEEEKRGYELINHPRAEAVPYYSEPTSSSTNDEQNFVDQVEKWMKIMNCHIKQGGRGCGKGRRGRCHGKGKNEPKDEVKAGEVLPAYPVAFGSHGPGVEQLQHFLIDNGFMDASAIKWRAGVYSHRTQEAIEQFQLLHGISGENLGTYDKATAEALQNLIAFKNGTHVDKPPTNTTVENDSQDTAEKSTRSPTPEEKSVDEVTPKSEVVEEDFVSVESVDDSQNNDPGKIEKKEEWLKELEILESMGFTDKELLRTLLNQNKVSDPERPLLATIAALLK